MDDDTRHAGPDEVVVRPTRPEDRAAVLAFCARIWEGDDYIPYVWDTWLADERGALLVAVAGERPVGLTHVTLPSDEDAWLQGVRVDPDERRQGIGRLLVSRALVAARERGATVVRLMTSPANAPAHGLFARFGFVRVAEVAHYTASALLPEDDDPGGTPAAVELVPETGGRLATPSEDDFERLWDWLVQSTLTPFNGGLAIVDWHARALSEPLLREALVAGAVWTLEERGTLQALAVAYPRPAEYGELAHLAVVYADGMADGLGRLALALREIAGERGCAEADLWLPDLLILRDAMEGAGYTRQGDHPMEIYARNV